MGIGAALTSIVEQNLGNNQINRVKEAFKKSFMLTIYISVAGCFLLLKYSMSMKIGRLWLVRLPNIAKDIWDGTDYLPHVFRERLSSITRNSARLVTNLNVTSLALRYILYRQK
ncbi:MATE family efflux transporter [Fonticella tunisiensis]|nr:MATE family efflux transporter [Fonticella tunisiensis]